MTKTPPPKPEDFFKLPDFQIPELPDSLKDYGRFAEIVWTSAPAFIDRYTKSVKETWDAYTDTYIKRFAALPTTDKSKFLNSGLDGAIVFLSMTMLSRMILNKYVDPYLLGAYRWPQHLSTRRRHYDNSIAGRSISYDKMKWIFTSSVLATVWHINTHFFYDFGKPFDLSIFFFVVSGLSCMNFQRTQSVTATLAFFLIPLLVLIPVSGTVVVMQHGPYIKDMKYFPYFLGAVTVITALYFMLEAPATPVVITSKNGYQRAIPFMVALHEEVRQLWKGDWSGTLMNLPRRMANRVAPGEKRGRHGKSRTGGQRSDKRTAMPFALVSGKMTAAFGPAYRIFENVALFFLGGTYRVFKFIKHVLQLVIDSVMGGVSSLPGMSQYFSGDGDKGRKRTTRTASSKSRGKSRTPRMSRRVSKTRDN